MPGRGLEPLFRAIVERPVAVTMTFLAAVVFGFVSFQRLPVELMPDISYPTVTVRTAFEGAAPQEVEAQVSQPVEESLATLDGLVTLESRSRAGNSDVVLGFDWGTDMNGAAQAIRESLQTTFLPEEADRPLLLRYDPSLEPFQRLALSYDPAVLKLPPEAALYLLREVAEQEIKRRLEAMKGVAAVRVRGGLEREMRAEVREDWLAARKLTLNDVRQVLAAENVNLAGGSVLEGDTEYLVRTLAEVREVEEIGALEIRRADGVVVPITDVAILRETHKDRTVVSHLDGAEAVELELYREADANVVDVAGRIHSVLYGTELGYDQAAVDAMDDGPMKDAMQEGLDGSGGLVKGLPAGVRLEVLDDQAAFVKSAIANVRDAVLLGGALAIVVLFLFLRDWRATAIIGISIPVSLVLGFAPLYLGGSTLNLMSLGGLALGVGMLVDNSVVVLEAIQRRIEEGANRVESAVLGTAEVAAAVTASTLTTVAVFVPIGLVEGIGGQLFGDLSLAVVGSLIASLAVALGLVPMLAALSAGAVVEAIPDPPPLRAALTEAVRAPVADWRSDVAASTGWRRAVVAVWVSLRVVLVVLVGVPLALLAWVLSRGLRLGLRVAGWVGQRGGGLAMRAADLFHAVYGRVERAYGGWIGGVVRRPSTVLAVAGGLLVLTVWGAAGLGTELVPEVHQGRFTVELALPVGTPIAITVDRVTRLEAEVGALSGVAATYTTIGSDGRADARSDEGEHTARVRVQLEEGGDPLATEERVLEQLRVLLAGEPDASWQVTRPSLFSFRTPLEVVVFGRDLDTLEALGRRLEAELSALPALTDVRSSLQRGNPEVRVLYDRARLARLGLDTATVAGQVRDRIQGVRATELHDGDQRLDLRVQLVESQRSSLADLRRLNINPNVEPPIPLDAVATFEEAVGPSEIRRVDQQRAVVLSANLSGLDLGGAIEAIEQTLRATDLGEGSSWVLGGQARELGGALTSLLFALALAVFLVYVVMAMTFEHLVHPLVILFSVPLAAIGVVLGLRVAGLPISVVAALGLIVLAGVVVNNAIVLVDAINHLRSTGLDRTTAIERAASTRLRPILVTTATTVLGLVPLAFGFGAGAEVQQPLAVTVIGGLSVSTLLTLGVVPAVYTLMTRDAPSPEPGTEPSP